MVNKDKIQGVFFIIKDLSIAFSITIEQSYSNSVIDFSSHFVWVTTVLVRTVHVCYRIILGCCTLYIFKQPSLTVKKYAPAIGHYQSRDWKNLFLALDLFI